MEYLDKEIKKNGFVYKFYKRGKKALIYLQTDPERDDEVGSYEVFKIRIDKPKVIFGISLPEREKFPGHEDFGKWAWACSTMDRAMSRFNEIEESVD